MGECGEERHSPGVIPNLALEANGVRPLGAVLSYWHDVYSEGYEDQLAHANVFPALILYADTFWCGRDNRDPKFWGRLPLADDPAFQVAVDLERRVEAQRTRVLGKTEWPFQFVPQTSLRWRMSDANGRLIAKNIAQATVTPRHPLFKQENADFVGDDVDTVVLETWIKSPKERTVGAWVGFTGFSRARGRTLPAKGAWGRHDACVEVNGEALPAPVWNHPGESRSIDQPFDDEEYYMRAPTPLKLQAGWNHVKLTVPRPPKSTLDDAWTATFIPILGDSRHPESVPGLIYSSDPPQR